MITTITRYPPTSVERLCALAGGVIASFLLALAVSFLLESSDTDSLNGRSVAAGPVRAHQAVVMVIERRQGTN